MYKFKLAGALIILAMAFITNPASAAPKNVEAVELDCENPCVNSYEIEDGEVGNNDLAADAVSGDKIQDGEVDTDDLADDAVTSAKIATDAVGTDAIDASEVQRRVSGTCAAGEAIAEINSDGSVQCESVGPEAVTEKLAFLSNHTFTGNLGGIQGADFICQQEADYFGFGGARRYKAWVASALLGGTTFDPDTRFVQDPNVPYYLQDNVLVADDYDDLTHSVGTDGPSSAVYRTLSGANAIVEVWAATGGGNDDPRDCNGWTSDDPLDYGLVGYTDDPSHFSNFGIRNCDQLRRIYCFEQ